MDVRLINEINNNLVDILRIQNWIYFMIPLFYSPKSSVIGKYLISPNSEI